MNATNLEDSMFCLESELLDKISVVYIHPQCNNHSFSLDSDQPVLQLGLNGEYSLKFDFGYWSQLDPL